MSVERDTASVSGMKRDPAAACSAPRSRDESRKAAMALNHRSARNWSRQHPAKPCRWTHYGFPYLARVLQPGLWKMPEGGKLSAASCCRLKTTFIPAIQPTLLYNSLRFNSALLTALFCVSCHHLSFLPRSIRSFVSAPFAPGTSCPAQGRLPQVSS